MLKYVFYSHAGSGNHGCEAIVRASEKILKKDIILYSVNPEQDRTYKINDVINYIYKDNDRKLQKYSIQWVASRVQTKLTKSIEKEIYYRKYDMLSSVSKGDVWFSIGGDNYCYPGTEILSAEREIIQKRGGRAVLWGCSVEPKLLQQKEIAKDLSQYDLITARETLSFQALKKVNHNTILVSDPAFTLQRIDRPLPEGWIKNNMIGVNVSPLILDHAQSSQVAYEAFYNLISKILTDTDCGIALIPHVVWKNNDDRKPLKELYKEFSKTGRVIQIGDCNCMELKGFIARCRMFIGARTHATIAAYSTCVPTLVLGYSVKSLGIATDIFGTDKNFVLPVQRLNSSNELADMFEWMLQHEEDIRSHLERKMNSYINKAYLAKEAVERL